MSDFAGMIGAVARELLGEPNRRLSSETELRWGNNGSLAVDLEKGTWFDPEQKVGGGVLDLIARETRRGNGEAIDWLREHRFDVEERREAPPRTRIAATYDYVDETGELLFQVVRYQPKRFLQRRRATDGDRPDKIRDGWIWSVKGVRQVPYRLPELLEAIAIGNTIFIVEGEKDVDALHALGCCATTNAMGAGKWPESLREFFVGADIVYLPDNDDSGRAHVEMVGANLKDVAARQRVLELPGLPAKGDVSDWIEAGGSADQLWALVESRARPFRDASESGGKPNGAGPASPKRSAALVTRRASDIAPEPIRWLWPNRIAIGKQTIVAGEPGLGKSQLTCSIAANVTTGGLWPNGEGTSPTGSVIILSAEDDATDTIRPRLDAAGADVSRVYIVSAVRMQDGAGQRGFNIQVDLILLQKEIERVGDVKLVIIDPVSSYLGKVDSHKNAELRAVLEPLGEMAARLGVAVVSITHLNKASGGSANSRFIGSIAFVAAARAAFVVARDPEDEERRLFIPSKNNIAPEGSGIGFRVGQVLTPSGILAPAIFWDSMPVKLSANEALNAPIIYGDAPARTEAEDFLREILAGGALPARRVESEARDAGLSMATIRRAKDRLGVRASKAGLDGGWVWSLPQGAHE